LADVNEYELRRAHGPRFRGEGGQQAGMSDIDAIDFYEDFVDQRVSVGEISRRSGISRKQLLGHFRKIAIDLDERGRYINAMRGIRVGLDQKISIEPPPDRKPAPPRRKKRTYGDELIREWLRSSMSNGRFRDYHKLQRRFYDDCRSYCREHGILWRPRNASYCLTPQEKLAKAAQLYTARKVLKTSYAKLARDNGMSGHKVRELIKLHERNMK
jgi:hypothetical protein